MVIDNLHSIWNILPQHVTSDEFTGYESVYDQLDSLNFPRKGALFDVNWISNRKSLGASDNQSRLRINALWAKTKLRDSIISWTSLGGILTSDTDVLESGYTLGGLFSLSGYQKFAFTGRYAYISRLMYLRDLSDNRSIVKIPWYAGASLEANRQVHSIKH